MRRIDVEGGGFRDMLVLIVLGGICLRLPQLAEAALGLSQPSQGTILRLVGVFSNESREAAMVVIPATIGLILLAGRHRDATLDLELGSACYAPFFVARAVARIAVVASGHAVIGRFAVLLAYGPACLWAGWVFLRALQVARSRPAPGATAPGAAPVTESAAASAAVEVAAPALVRPAADPPVGLPPGLARTGGWMAIAVLVIGLGVNVAWASRHYDALKPIVHGEAAPGFDLPRVDATAGRLSLASLRGKVVLLDVWATWCPPCLQMIPVLHDLHREWLPRGVEFVGVSSDGAQTSPDEIRAFLHSRPSPYPMVLDDGTANTLYKIRALPQMILIDREGAIRRVFIGVTSRRDLASALADAVRPSTAETAAALAPAPAAAATP